MDRAFPARLAALALTFVVLTSRLGSTAHAASPGRPSRLSSQEQAELLQYANDTWRSFERMTLPSGLPADSLIRDGGGWGSISFQTSPTNIAAYLWSVLAAERLRLISPEDSQKRLERTLSTLAGMERHHGFFLNDLDPRTGAALKISSSDPSPRRPLLSAVDNAWLATALVMVANSHPKLRQKATELVQSMDFRFFYDPYDPGDPLTHPGQLRVGYWADDQSFYGHYGMLNSEARIASYLGISRKQLPPEHYYHMYRTFPEQLGPQAQTPQGPIREYLGVKVREGSYTYRGKRIVPSWGGSMFEALMVTLFVPEDVWAPQSWRINHPLYVKAQIEHGLEEARYGAWGFSPAMSPHGGYEVYGVKALGTDPLGYLSYDISPDVPPAQPGLLFSKMRHGVVTPHASFLALRYAPREAIDNLRKLATKFPIYSQFGFLDSVDVSAGLVSGCVLALDQGMIMAAIANELADDAMQHAFSDGAVEQSIRPLIAMEEFSAGSAPLADRLRARIEPAALKARLRAKRMVRGSWLDCDPYSTQTHGRAAFGCRGQTPPSCPLVHSISGSGKLSVAHGSLVCLFFSSLEAAGKTRTTEAARGRRTRFQASMELCLTLVAPYAILCSGPPRMRNARRPHRVAARLAVARWTFLKRARPQACLGGSDGLGGAVLPESGTTW